MSIIRVTREFSFEMAHILGGYDGPCRNLHGHSYKLFVTLIGSPNTNKDDPKKGMVMDFSVMKKIVLEEVVDKFDHSIVLNSEYSKLNILKDNFEHVNVVDFQPTCENLIAYFASLLKDKFPEGIKLYSLKLYETAKLFAEWYADDNE